MSGNMEEQLSEYYAEVAVSGFGDMLHDVDRNVKYEAAIKLAIDEVKKRGQKANVLDIGTGTGLLSMMAVRHGADTVVACEYFQPMSECARKTVRLNGFDTDQIRVIPKRSTDLEIREDGSADLSERCNILVTEIFDTELIGEGAISIFNHAIDNLLTQDCVVVPATAEIFVQLVESSYLKIWHILEQQSFAYFKACRLPDYFEKCPGTLPMHDVQLSQLKSHQFNAITVEPVAVFKFDFRKKLKKKDTKKLEFRAERSGTVQNVFMWWQLEMDRDGKHKISCAPDWQSPMASARWRDHWMQAIYYIPEAFRVERNEVFTLAMGHDEYSFWFQKDAECTCGLHAIATRAQIARLNDRTTLEKFGKILRNKLSSRDLKKCLFFADLSLIPFLFHNLELNFSWLFCDKKPIQQIVSKIFENNQIRFLDASSSTTLDDTDVIVIEPNFLSNFLPWDSLTVVSAIQKCLQRNFALTVIPMRTTIHALAVSFCDLFKMTFSVKECNGFKMTVFDDLLKESRKMCAENVEPYALWEYPAYCLSRTTELFDLQLDTIIEEDFVSREALIEIDQTVDKRQVNGIAIWIDWHLDDDKNNRISSGPTVEPKLGAVIDWYKYVKQGVHFIEVENQVRRIEIKTQFAMKSGRFRFDFAY